MATISPGLFTYSEWAARRDPNGKISTLVNLLSQQNSILDDLIAVECQSGNAFEYTQVVKLPTPQRRSYNQGVVRTMAGVAKQVTTCSEYADWATIDASLANLGGNVAQTRADEDFLHMQGMSQQIASDLFYSNRVTDPTAFTGLANIYNTVNPTTSQIARNVIDAGGTQSDNASMWLIGWGPKQIHTIFPNGTPAGLQHIDMGILPIVDASGNEFRAYRTWLQWNIGLAIHDWRYAVRIANIDVSNLGGVNAANILNLMATAVLKPPVMPVGVGPVQTSDDPRVTIANRSAFYVNRTVYGALQQQVTNKTNILLQLQQWAGMTVLTYQGIPIRIVDALLTTEARVV
jgi:hypothetical protein